MKLRSTLLAAATVLAVPMAAQAQMPMPNLSGFYVGAGVGANWLMQHGVSAGGVGSTNIDSHPAGIADGYLGYELGNGLSLRIDGNVMGNPAYQTTTGRLGATGWEQKQGAMAYLMFDLSPYIPIKFAAPYAGIGVGYEWDKLTGGYGYGTVHADGTEGALAYGAIVGLQMPLGYTGLSLTLEYHLLGQNSRNYSASYTPAGDVAPVGTTLHIGREWNNAVLVGVRYTFGVTAPAAPPPPAPAPVAAPAPAPARSYLVFFDWDKATLTDRAREIIREAADNSRHVQFTRLLVNGYTDTSGKPAYNQRLSVRRAENVAAELVRDGVPRQAIEIHGYGETHLLVPTGPGVREPQNRRVEIIIQ